MFNIDENNTFINNLKKLGVRLSLDDFGAGYSSLSYLKQFPINTLKIDKSFTQDLAKEGNSSEIVYAIIDLAKSLDLTTVAEGVETLEQLEFLKLKGCDYFQGYLFSRAVPSNEFIKLLTRQTH